MGALHGAPINLSSMGASAPTAPGKVGAYALSLPWRTHSALLAVVAGALPLP